LEISPPPVAANVLDGFTRFGSTVLITVPAGRTWIGMVGISGTLVDAPAAGATNASAGITTTGTGVIPAAGTYVELVLTAPAAGTILNAGGTGTSGSITMPMVVVAPVGNAVTLTTAFFNMTQASYFALGCLV
jgi:hypothetical protein